MSCQKGCEHNFRCCLIVYRGTRERIQTSDSNKCRKSNPKDSHRRSLRCLPSSSLTRSPNHSALFARSRACHLIYIPAKSTRSWAKTAPANPHSSKSSLERINQTLERYPSRGKRLESSLPLLRISWESLLYISNPHSFRISPFQKTSPSLLKNHGRRPESAGHHANSARWNS